MKIICQNTNGITSKINQLPNHDVKILTETHQLSNKKEQILKMQKGYQYVCSQGSRNSKGVVILYKNEYKTLKTEIDSNGNFIIITLQTQDETFQIIGIYIDTGFGKQKEINQILFKCKNFFFFFSFFFFVNI